MSVVRRLLMVPIVLVLTEPAWALSERECRRDSQELLTEISRNRQRSVDLYLQAQSEAATERERALLKEQMEEVWQEEEIQLAQADQALRDCLSYVKFLQKSSTNQ